MSNSLWPHGLQAFRLLCPQGFPGKNTEVDGHFLFQGTFPNQWFVSCTKVMLIKSMWYCCTTIRMAKKKKKQNNGKTKCLWGCGVTRTLIHCWWESKMVQPLWKAIWLFIIKLNSLITWSSNCTPWLFTQGVKNSYKLLCERRLFAFLYLCLL